MREIQEQIEKLLLSTGREGIGALIIYMRECGFYEAPCSSQYHLAKQGGLAEHSLNVMILADKLRELLAPDLPVESVILCALLHDLGKAGQFGKTNYVPNMLTARATKANPNPEPYQSTKKPYTGNPELLYVDHEVRSIQIAERYIRLTENENWAILMHNGLYGPFKHQIQGKETPLYLILHMADMWASHVLEKDGEVDGRTEED